MHNWSKIIASASHNHYIIIRIKAESDVWKVPRKWIEKPLSCSLSWLSGVAFAWPAWEHLRGRCSGAWELIGWRVGGVGVIALPFFFQVRARTSCCTFSVSWNRPCSENLPLSGLTGHSTDARVSQMRHWHWHPWGFGVKLVSRVWQLDPGFISLILFHATML